MKVNELRIGNYVEVLTKDNSKDPMYFMKVSQIDANDFFYFDDEVYFPTALTKEWLLNFGFKQCENEFWFKKDIISISLEVGIYDIDGMRGDFVSIRKKPIKFVHQIQNLYFSIVNDELIKI